MILDLDPWGRIAAQIASLANPPEPPHEAMAPVPVAPKPWTPEQRINAMTVSLRSLEDDNAILRAQLAEAILTVQQLCCC